MTGLKKPTTFHVFIHSFTSVMPSQPIALSLTRYTFNKKLSNSRFLSLIGETQLCIAHFQGSKPVICWWQIFKSANNPCSKNHASNTGGSQLQRSESLHFLQLITSFVHAKLSLQTHLLPKRRLCQTMIIKSRVNITAFNTYSRHFGLNHCSEYISKTA